MNILFKSILILYYSFNILLVKTVFAFAYSTSTTTSSSTKQIKHNNNNFYFRSAKKITGASSHDNIHKPIIPKTTKSNSHSNAKSSSSSLSSTSSSDNIDIDDDDDDEIELGKMRVSEIKAELDLREVTYHDCFDKESLKQRLQEARINGIANPSILDKFNKQKVEELFNTDKKINVLNDNDINNAIANDGKLPGGLTPEQFKLLSTNPEIMLLLQNTKMQDAMKLMMTGNQNELNDTLKNDKELQEMITKLDNIMKSTMT